jgi:hypothetical protein
MNSRDWPIRAPTSGGNGDVDPIFNFGHYSNYDCNALHWRSLHTATNTIDWTNVNALVTAMQGRGVSSGTFAIYGCPTFLAQAGQESVAGPFGGLGEGSYPTNLAQLTYFCQQFAARNISAWGGFWRNIQLFNEPEGGSFSGTASASNFFWGSATQYVDMLYTAYSALKAADPTLVLLCPGTYNMTVLATWLSATGPVTGKLGHETFDAVATHPYHAVPNGAYSGRGDFTTLAQGGLTTFRNALAPYGKSGVDFYATEYGIDSSASTGVVANFLALSAANRAKEITRRCMAAARSGLKTFAPYSYGGSQLVGDLPHDTTGSALGYKNAYDGMAGKTINAGGYYPDGREWLQFTDGTSMLV